MGVFAAGFYGAFVSLLRWRWGLPAALAAHVFTDVVVFSAVAAAAIYSPT